MRPGPGQGVAAPLRGPPSESSCPGGAACPAGPWRPPPSRWPRSWGMHRSRTSPPQVGTAKVPIVSAGSPTSPQCFQGPLQGPHEVPRVSTVSPQGPHRASVVSPGSPRGPHKVPRGHTGSLWCPQGSCSIPMVSTGSPQCPHKVHRFPMVPPWDPQGPPRCPHRGGLAQAALVARVNGTLQDLDRPLESDTDLELLDFSTPEGRAVSPTGHGGWTHAPLPSQRVPRVPHIPPSVCVSSSHHSRLSGSPAPASWGRWWSSFMGPHFAVPRPLRMASSAMSTWERGKEMAGTHTHTHVLCGAWCP